MKLSDMRFAAVGYFGCTGAFPRSRSCIGASLGFTCPLCCALVSNACCAFIPTNVTTIINATMAPAMTANFPEPLGVGVGFGLGIWLTLREALEARSHP